MLYDIVSPVAFFLSLGGIIWVVSRVVLRMRRIRFSHRITHLAPGDDKKFEQQMRPTQRHIELFKSPLLLWMKQVREVRRAVMELPGRVKRMANNRSPAKILPNTISMPTLRWGKISSLSKPVIRATKTIARRLKSLGEPRLAPALPVAKVTPLPPAVTEPILRLVTKPTVVTPAFFKKKKPVPSQVETARVALESAHYKQAEDALVPYLFKHAQDTAAYMLLGRAALGQKNWGEAVEIFEQVIKRNAGEEGAYAALGYAAHRQGKFTRALWALQRAHEADPENTDVLSQLLAIAQKMDNRGLQHSIQNSLKQARVRS